MKYLSGKTFVEALVWTALISAIALSSTYKLADAQLTGSSFNAGSPGPLGYVTPSPATFSGLSAVTGAVPACTGCIGELLTMTIPAASAVSMATATLQTFSQLGLTAGSYLCEGTCGFQFSATTSITLLACGMNSASGVMPNLEARGAFVTAAMVPGLTLGITLPIPKQQFLFSGPGAVYPAMQSSFSIAAEQGFVRLLCLRNN